MPVGVCWLTQLMRVGHLRKESEKKEKLAIVINVTTRNRILVEARTDIIYDTYTQVLDT